MPTDKENVSFLYSIIRQLETKHVSWKIVAHDNDITNDHAARMRFHRLRQQFEGLTPKKRGPRKNADGKGKCRAEFGDNASDEEDDKGGVKKERKRKCKTEDSESEEDALAKHRAKKCHVGVKQEPGVVKREPGEGPSAAGSANVAGVSGPKPLEGQSGNSIMRPAAIAFGMAPPPPHAQGPHFGYRPMMPPGAHYRGVDRRMGGVQMHGAPMSGPPGSMGGPPASRMGSPMPGLPRTTLSGPPPSGMQQKSGPQMAGSPMSRMSLLVPPPKTGSPMSGPSRPGPPMPGLPLPGLQMSGPPMSRMQQSGPPLPSGPLGQQNQQQRVQQQQMQQQIQKQMQAHTVSRPMAPLPLRPKNVPWERMPPRVGDVPQTAENAVPAMQR